MSTVEGIRPGPRGGKKLALLLLSEKGKHVGGKAEDQDEDFDPELPHLPSGSPLKIPGRRSWSKNNTSKPKTKDSEFSLDKSMRLNKRFIDPKYYEVHDEVDKHGKHKGTFTDSNIIHTPASGTTLLASPDRHSPSDPLKGMSFDYIENT